VESSTARRVKIAQGTCVLRDNARYGAARTVIAMVDLISFLGQAASVALLIYGGFLVLMPAKKPATGAERDEMRLMHLRTHA
jgi:hypothetical protein